MTGKNDITIKYTANELKNILNIFHKKEEDEVSELLSIDNEGNLNWKVANGKKDVCKTNATNSCIKEILYRPFDSRFTYYTGKSNGFHVNPQFKVCKNMLFENIGLLLHKQSSKGVFRRAFCTKLIPEMCAVSANEKETNLLFPLYLYPDAALTSKQEELEREENFTSGFRNYIDEIYGEGISPEQILGYIYAVLYNEAYSRKHREFSKDKLTRIPFVNNKIQFEKLSRLGQTLIEVHLLKNQIDLDLGKLIGKGSCAVENILFTEEDAVGKIYINETQSFNNVPPDVWKFQIGEYYVIENFLKERMNKVLTSDEVDNIELIINVIAFTIKQMKKIENTTKSWI